MGQGRRSTRSPRRASSSTAARGRSTARRCGCSASAPPTPATLDAVMREAGAFRMGPFELMDLIGLDVNFAVTRSVWEALLPRSALRAVDPAAGARRGRLARPQVRARLLRLRARRGEARARDRDRAVAPVAHRRPWATVRSSVRCASALRQPDSISPRARQMPRSRPRISPWTTRLLVPSDGRTATSVAVAGGQRECRRLRSRARLSHVHAARGRRRATPAARRLRLPPSARCRPRGIAVSRIDDVAGHGRDAHGRDARQRGGRRGESGHRERARRRSRDAQRRQLSDGSARLG